MTTPALSQEAIAEHMEAAKAARLAWLAALIPETGNGTVPLFYRAAPIPGDATIIESHPFLVVGISQDGQVALAYQWGNAMGEHQDSRGFSMWTHRSHVVALSARDAVRVQEHMAEAVKEEKIASLWPGVQVQVWGRDTLARFLVEVSRPQGEALRALLEISKPFG